MIGELKFFILFMLEELKFFILFMLCIFAIFALILLPFVVAYYYSSCLQAEIYNEKYGEDYSGWDFFWAGSQINQQTQTINIE